MTKRHDRGPGVLVHVERSVTFAAHKRYTMPQDSGARLKSKRKATLKLNKRAAAAAAKGEKPKGKPAKKKA